MPEETETVTGNPAQEQNNEDQKDNANHTENQNDQSPEAEMQLNSENDSQPSVEACILKAQLSNEEQNQTGPKTSNDTEDRVCSSNKRLEAKSLVVIATESFLFNEQNPSELKGLSDTKLVPCEAIEQTSEETTFSLSKQQALESELEPHSTDVIEPRTPANSEASEGGAPFSGGEIQESIPAHVHQVSYEIEPIAVTPIETPITVNGDMGKELLKENSLTENDKLSTEIQLNGQSNSTSNFEQNKESEQTVEPHSVEKNQVIIESIANELKTEDYKLPDVDEVKKNFEGIHHVHNDVTVAPPKKGALSTRLDSQNVRKAYEDVRCDGSKTQWAVFKFEGPLIVTSAIGSDFSQFKAHFHEEERAFGYIRVQTGDELSRRAKFLLVTWVGPSVSVLKRAKMSTDKALIKEILTNFAVELQTENILDIELHNFENELDKAAGAHYGTGVRC